MYYNKAIIIGNLTRDPELKTLPSGVAVTNFSVATSRVWKDKSGVRQEDTQFHNIVAFGQQANIIAQYMKKGSSVLVEGRIQNRSWDSPEGKKYRTEIVLENVQFGPKREAGNTETFAPKEENTTNRNSDKTLDTIQYPEEDINPEDIPF